MVVCTKAGKEYWGFWCFHTEKDTLISLDW